MESLRVGGFAGVPGHFATASSARDSSRCRLPLTSPNARLCFGHGLCQIVAGFAAGGAGERWEVVCVMDIDRKLIVAERRRSQRVVQITVAVLALIALATDLLVSLASGPMGIAGETAQAITFGCLSAGSVSTAILYVWDRVYTEEG